MGEEGPLLLYSFVSMSRDNGLVISNWPSEVKFRSPIRFKTVSSKIHSDTTTIATSSDTRTGWTTVCTSIQIWAPTRTTASSVSRSSADELRGTRVISYM
jgi:hypothetical protein